TLFGRLPVPAPRAVRARIVSAPLLVLLAATLAQVEARCRMAASANLHRCARLAARSQVQPTQVQLAEVARSELESVYKPFLARVGGVGVYGRGNLKKTSFAIVSAVGDSRLVASNICGHTRERKGLKVLA